MRDRAGVLRNIVSGVTHLAVPCVHTDPHRTKCGRNVGISSSWRLAWMDFDYDLTKETREQRLAQILRTMGRELCFRCWP